MLIKELAKLQNDLTSVTKDALKTKKENKQNYLQLTKTYQETITELRST